MLHLCALQSSRRSMQGGSGYRAQTLDASAGVTLLLKLDGDRAGLVMRKSDLPSVSLAPGRDISLLSESGMT